jgi:hypothetical protein
LFDATFAAFFAETVELPRVIHAFLQGRGRTQDGQGKSRMAFIPGYDHDIFVSYAHVDDACLLDDQPIGWVAKLVELLRKKLAQRFGRPEHFSLWFDTYDLRGNHTVTDEIAARVRGAALFVAVLSPGYVASRWCLEEARLFGLTPGDLRQRVFVVHLSGEDISVPPVLSGRRAYRFWYRDRANQPRIFAIPTPHHDEVDYFRQIEDLACDLYSQCHVMCAGSIKKTIEVPGRAASVLPAVAGSVVLLAEVTDDLEFKRAEVRRYLEAHDVRVLPEQTYPLGSADFSAALDADLAPSQLFVQLLGPIEGKRPRDLPGGYCWLQLESAKRRGVPVLQWRNPELDLSSVEWPRQREILELATVQATSLESFKRTIIDALTPASLIPSPRRGVANRPLVFLNTEARHRAIAIQIRDAIGSRADWAEPLFEGPAEELREDLEQNLIECDAMVMLYADNPSWARAQLRQFRKLSPRREHPVIAIPVIDGPPPDKPDLGMSLDGLVIIDSRAGIGLDTLSRLSETLHI